MPPSGKFASNNQREPQDSSGPTCSYCEKRGHVIGDCWTLQRKNAKSPNALSGQIGPTVNENEHIFPGQNMSKFGYALDSCKPFISEG